MLKNDGTWAEAVTTDTQRIARGLRQRGIALLHDLVALIPWIVDFALLAYSGFFSQEGQIRRHWLGQVSRLGRSKSTPVGG